MNKLIHVSSFLLLASVIAGCERKDAQLKMPQRPPPSVSVMPALTKEVPIYLEEIGRTTATESVTIQPQVTGRVTEVHFIDGAMVKKNDLLFTIDPRPFQAVLDQAVATLAQDEANLRWSQAEFARVQGLKNTGAVSQSDLESKQNAVAVAEAQIKSAQAAIEKSKLDLEYCTIRSPIDGRTGHRLVDPGNVVANSGPDGGTKMLSIQRLQPIYADFTVTEQDLHAVRENMKDHPLRAQVWAPSAPEHIGEGDITFLDNTVQGGSGTIQLRATLPNTDSHFWPNQYVQVRLILSTLKSAILVPNSSTQIGQTGPYVFVVHEDTTAELRPVTVGQRQGDMVVIMQGLSPGESVITAGQMSVMPGGKVRPMPVATTAPSAPTTGQSVAKGGQ